MLDVLPRLERRGETFDVIILDPPTFFARQRWTQMAVGADLEGLLQTALALAAPRARLLVSTNCTRLDRAALEAIARGALKLTRRAASFIAKPALPDVPPAAAAETLWLF